MEKETGQYFKAKTYKHDGRYCTSLLLIVWCPNGLYVILCILCLIHKFTHLKGNCVEYASGCPPVSRITVTAFLKEKYPPWPQPLLKQHFEIGWPVTRLHKEHFSQTYIFICVILFSRNNIKKERNKKLQNKCEAFGNTHIHRMQMSSPEYWFHLLISISKMS